MVSATVAAAGPGVTPRIRSPPAVSETLAPCDTAPGRPSTPTAKAARIVGSAPAPTAGANGVAPGEPAPIVQAVNRLAAPASAGSPAVSMATILVSVSA